MAKPLVIFDTSVLFSFVWNPEKPYASRHAYQAGKIIAVTCNSAIDELIDVSLRYTDQSRVDLFLHDFRKCASVQAEPRAAFALHADPKDSIFLNLAIEA